MRWETFFQTCIFILPWYGQRDCSQIWHHLDEKYQKALTWGLFQLYCALHQIHSTEHRLVFRVFQLSVLLYFQLSFQCIRLKISYKSYTSAFCISSRVWDVHNLTFSMLFSRISVAYPTFQPNLLYIQQSFSSIHILPPQLSFLYIQQSFRYVLYSSADLAVHLAEFELHILQYS
jgi:hypothetical protein